MIKGASTGLKSIRTMNTSKRRSIPGVQSSPYLDLYILHKEKGRLGREFCVIEKRKKSLQKRLSDINTEMAKLEALPSINAVAASIPEGTGLLPAHISSNHEKGWKVMSLKY